MTQKQIYKMGADAYIKGKSVNDNPFNKEKQPCEYYDWQFAFNKEKEYWETQK